MLKRGQLTAYIILCIVMLLILLLVFYSLTPIRKKEVSPMKENINSQVTTFIEGCIKQQASKALALIGYQGGWIVPPEGASFAGFSVGFGYFMGMNILPDADTVSKEVSDFVERHLEGCTKELESVTNIKITKGKIKAETIITPQEVSIKVNYPLTPHTKKEETISDFSQKIPVKLGGILNDISQLIDYQVKNPHYMPLDKLKELRYNSQIIIIDRDTKVYTFIDPESTLYERPYVFWVAQKIEENLPPYLPELSPFELSVNQPFTHTFVADDFEGDEVTYFNQNKQFPISSNGTMQVMSTSTGTFKVPITAIDSFGNINTKEMTFIIR